MSSVVTRSNRDPARTVTLAGLTAGASLEWRISRSLSARALAGVWVVGNAVDLGGQHTPATRPQCADDASDMLACAAYTAGTSLHAAPMLALDLGWSF